MLTSLHSAKDDRIFFKEALSLKNKGFDVSILCLADGDGFIKDMAGNVLNLGLGSCIRSDGIDIYCVQKEQGFLEKILHKIGKGKTWKNYIVKGREIVADVYHAHEPQTAFIGIQIQKNTNAKLIYDAHEPWIFSRSAKEWILKKICLPRLKNIITANHITEQSLLGEKSDLNTEVIYNCSPSFFAQHQKENKEVIICHEGSLLFNRGLKLIIKALVILKKTHPNFRFRIIGDVFGEEKNFLENKIITNDLENNIEITGWLSYNDVPKSIADCSIGLITNTNEKRNTLAGPPNKLFNYMTMGLAIITVDLPATNTIIKETTCGIILEKRNAQFLAKAIQNLLENTAKRKRFQENALHWEKKRFNWQSEEEKLFQFYNRLK
jgi:glycosyltransferase involved in cell wall biosynthesis